jgi:hypothetical protein
VPFAQGDQIFACWAIGYLGQFFEHYRSSQKVWTTFSTEDVTYKYINFGQKWVGVCSFWAIFDKLICSPCFCSQN